jgi:hypothetical protein
LNFELRKAQRLAQANSKFKISPTRVDKYSPKSGTQFKI